jgi:DNA-binding PadR family transcriptional regulator
MPDDVLYRTVSGELDVVDDRAVAEPDEPFGSGGDLRVVGGEQDRDVVFGAQPGEQVKVRRMPLHHAVLALLAAKPAHGYELKSSFDQAVGDQWGGLNIGHVYQILDRLSRDGLIDSQRQPQQVKPDRVIHRLTPAGRAELDRWLAEPAVPARGYRDDFFLKIMAALRSADPATLPAVLGRQRAHLLRQLHALADARATTGTTAVESLLITAAELHIRADLGVVDAAEKTLATGATAPVSEQPSAATTPPQSAAG